MLALAVEALLPLAQLETVSDLAPYMAMFAFGFLLGAWGQAAKYPLAVALGILIVIAAVLLFQFEANDFSSSNSPF